MSDFDDFSRFTAKPSSFTPSGGSDGFLSDTVLQLVIGLLIMLFMVAVFVLSGWNWFLIFTGVGTGVNWFFGIALGMLGVYSMLVSAAYKAN